MITKEFKKAYKQLNPEQKKAVDTVEGAVMVIAGPGTGKTQILTLRIANILLTTDTPPGAILALTFTESGVSAMRKRLVEIMGSEGYKVYITTFHGFANDVIRNNPENFRHLADSEPITDLEQIQILEQILLESDLKVLKPFGDPIFYTKSVLAAINDLKKEGVSTAEFAKAVSEQKKSFAKIDDLVYEKGPYKGRMKGKYADAQKAISKNEELVKVYEMYQEVLQKQNLYDYSDMIMEVAKALEKDEDLRLSLQERYLYILVDEHQDTNFAQNRILEFLTMYFDNPNLLIVGDEKQAIYRFQGASLDNFLYFKKLYPEAVLINLEKNYRSTQAVLDASGSLIEKNITAEKFSQLTRLMSTVDYPLEKIKVASFNSPYSELKFIAEDIALKIKNGVEPKEIAVVFRNNKDVFPLIEALDQTGVIYHIESDQDLLSDIEVRKVLDILKAVNHLGEDQYLIPLLHMDFFEVPPMDIFKVIKFARKNHLSLYEILNDPKKHQTLILAQNEKLQKLYLNLCNWVTLSKNDVLENLYIAILQQSGMIKKVLQAPKSLEKMDKLSTFYSEIRNYTLRNSKPTLEGFLNYIQLLEDHQLLIKHPLKIPLVKSVRLMTAHRSKGLEFEYVYIINSFDGHWGNQKHSVLLHLPWKELGVNVKDFPETEDRNSDERRLFYVAMTRAKKSVLISYSIVSADGKEQLPSQFVEEIAPEFKEEINTSEFEQQLQIKPEQLFFLSEKKTDFKNQEFFNSIFTEEGLSVTGLNNYLECPWKYFYLNLIQIPLLKERSQIYGNAIHNALCKIIGSTKKSKKMLLDFYEDGIKKEELSKKDLQELLEKGTKTLSDYYDNFHQNWNQNIICEYAINGVQLSNEQSSSSSKVKISGRIDRIQTIPNSQNVIITDLKTGKPKSRNVIEGKTKASAGDYKRQLNFYKLLIDGSEQKKWVAKKGVIEFVEPDEKGKFHKEEFDFDVQELGDLKKQILQVSQEIINLDFWDQRCGEKDCQYCRLREMLDN